MNTGHISWVDLYSTDPAQHLVTACWDLDCLPVDDLSVDYKSIDDVSVDDLDRDVFVLRTMPRDMQHRTPVLG